VVGVPSGSESTYTLALVDTRAMADRRQRAQLELALVRDGVVAFIDPNHYFAIQRERAEPRRCEQADGSVRSGRSAV
jgi:hypothetical protein